MAFDLFQQTEDLQKKAPIISKVWGWRDGTQGSVTAKFETGYF
jgi:hypothetical protein